MSKTRMTEEQYLLITLSEELAEVQKEIAKCLRFGLYTLNPDTGVPNEYSLQTEMYEAISLFEDLQKTVFSDIEPEQVYRIMEDKVERVKYYYNTFDIDEAEGEL